VAFRGAAENPAFAAVFENHAGYPLFATSTDWAKRDTGTYAPGDEALFSVSLENAFAPGRLFGSPWVMRREDRDLMDRRPRIASAVVTGTHVSGGLVDLPHDISLERAGETMIARASSA
jgi:hypothetical protein